MSEKQIIKETNILSVIIMSVFGMTFIKKIDVLEELSSQQ